MFWLLYLVSCVVKQRDGDIKRSDKNGDVSILVRLSYFYILPFFSLSSLGHCVLCKDVLSLVFQTFDFQVLCFGFCVLCPVLLNGAIET